MCQQGKMQQWMRGLLLAIFAILSVISLSACTSHQQTSSPIMRGAAAELNDKKVFSDFGRYYALVIGNQDYNHLPKLNTPVADAEEIAQILKEQYGFEVDILLNKTRAEIMDAISQLCKRMNSERDNLLIYYAGHGALDNDSNLGYWQPVDAEKYSDTNWIPTFLVAKKLNGIKAKHVLIIADCCYSVSLLDPGQVRGYGGKQLSLDVGWQEWLLRMQKERSRTALTAGGKEQVLDGIDHSVFAKAFLEVLKENNGILDGNSLFDRIKTKVVRVAQQTPQYDKIPNAGENRGDFLLVHKDHPPIKEPESRPDIHVGEMWMGEAQDQTINTDSSRHYPHIKIVHNESTFDLAQRVSNELNKVGFQTELKRFGHWNSSVLDNGLTSLQIPLDNYTLFFPDSLQGTADKVTRIVNTLLGKEELVNKRITNKDILTGTTINTDETLIVLKGR